MQDIEVGEVYEVGRNRGPRRGVEFSGMRGVVVRTHVNAYDSEYGKKGYVLLHALDKDGLISLAGDEPRNIWAQSREVATREMLTEKQAAQAVARQAQIHQRQRQREYEDSVTLRLAHRLNVEPDELSVGVYTNDDGSYRIYRVQLDAQAAKKYLGIDG